MSGGQNEDVGGKTDKGARLFDSVGGEIKIKNKAKKKANSKTKKENQSKNKSKKEWKQR